jgi:hypothetical protein
MDIEKFIQSENNITAYKIVDNKIVYYSTNYDLINSNTNESKFWGKLFDLSYQKMENLTDAINSTEVWKNSYDGTNIAEEEMNEWLNDTISRINKFITKDCKVLEIGSGNGLIFNSIINKVSKYTGTDIAEKGLKLIANSKNGKLNANKIELYQLDALNIDKVPEEKFNLIIINSVAQYFPTLDYLFNVFKKLEVYASSNCVIFLGDIRSYELQKLFYLDVLNKKHPELNDFELKNKISFLKSRENETFYHTQLFNLFPTLFDYINSNLIELKKGKYNNELNLYRYDVTLMCNANQEEVLIISVNWENLKEPELEIREKLRAIKNNEVLEIFNIPNIRYINIVDKYKELFSDEDGFLINKQLHKSNLIVPSISYFTELASQENVFLQTNFGNKDFFKITAQYSKKQIFNTPKLKNSINYKQLSNKLNEKLSLKDKELEEKIQEIFIGFELIKVSNYLLRD